MLKANTPRCTINDSFVLPKSRVFSDETILAFIDMVHRFTINAPDPADVQESARVTWRGRRRQLVGLWQIFARQQTIPARAKPDAVLVGILTPFCEDPELKS